MSDKRVRVRAKDWQIGRQVPRCRVIVEEFVCPGDKVLPVRGIGVTRVMLPPSELAIEQPGIHGWHFRVVIVLIHSEILRAQ